MTALKISELPAAAFDVLTERIGDRTPAVFLDYDGTLTPIVRDPTAALLDEGTRAAIRRLAALCPTAIVSGRDHDDVKAMVDLEEVVYAGSHGFHISGPDGLAHEHPDGVAALPHLDRAEQQATAALVGIPGAWVERKRFAVAVHYRDVAESRVADVENAVRAAAERDGLRVTGGKMIFELRPAIDWDKGRAVLWLLETLGLDHADVVPLYVGDDVTDEDAFRALAGRGIGVVVEGETDHETAADYRLPDTAAARGLLDDLVRLLSLEQRQRERPRRHGRSA